MVRTFLSFQDFISYKFDRDNLRLISIYDEVKQSAHPEHLILILPKGTKEHAFRSQTLI